jgi:hypothetical protein
VIVQVIVQVQRFCSSLAEVQRQHRGSTEAVQSGAEKACAEVQRCRGAEVWRDRWTEGQRCWCRGGAEVVQTWWRGAGANVWRWQGAPEVQRCKGSSEVQMCRCAVCRDAEVKIWRC